jgi:hypothetical protein
MDSIINLLSIGVVCYPAFVANVNADLPVRKRVDRHMASIQLSSLRRAMGPIILCIELDAHGMC